MNRESNTNESVGSEAVSDWACVLSVQSGNTDAFEVLVRRHQKIIFNLAYRMLSDYDEATEVAQEVFLSAFRSIKQFRGEASFSTWLFRIALNHAGTRRKSLTNRRKREASLDEAVSIGDHDSETVKVRQKRKGPWDDADPVGGAVPDPVKFAEMQQSRSLVQAALEKLSREHCEIITLIDMQGESYEAAADIVGIKIETVKTRLHRARLALKTELAPIFKERGSR